MRIAFSLFWFLSLILSVSRYCNATTAACTEIDDSWPSQPSIITFAGEPIEIGKSLFIYEDHDYNLTVNKAMDTAFARNFVQSNSEIGNVGNTKAIIWCRFNVRNNTETPLFLVLSNPLVNDAVFYEVDNESGRIDSTFYSSFYPFKDRAIHVPDFAFPLGVRNGGERTCFLKFETTYPLYFPLTISSESQLLQKHNNTSLFEGLFFGVVAIMILYNFFIFLGIKDKIYLSYIAYVTGVGLFVAHVKGFAFAFIWPELPWINEFPAIIPSLTTLGALFFSSQFLKVKKYHPGVFRLMQVSYLLLGVSIAFNVAHIMDVLESRVLITISGVIIQVTVVFASSTLVLAGVKAYKRGFLPAKAYLVAWVSLIFSVTTFVSYNLGIIPGNIWVRNSTEFGVALEACLLSFALTIKINQEKNDRQKAEQLVLIKERETRELALQKEIEKSKTIEEERARLEVKVAERTEELSKLNSTKDHFFSIISHDLRSVITSFHGVGHMIKQHLKKERFQKATVLADQLDKEANNLHGLLDNLLNWSINQLGETPFRLATIDLNDTITKVYELYLETAKSKEINFEMDLAGHREVEADFDALNIILRNLISNAIKFTKANGNIRINAVSVGDSVEVMITDTGVGISTEIIEAINESVIMESANGTSGEKGNGLGLKLCKEYLKLHGSELKINSLPEGSVFQFLLKKAG